MGACLLLWIVLAQTLDFSASQDFRYIQRFEGESVDLFCFAQPSTLHPTILHLRRKFADSESVINFSEDDEVRADPETEGHIKISGQLKLRSFTVTLSHLKHTDTGLYVCDFSGNSSDQLSNAAIFLHVHTSGEPCSCRRYSQLIYTLSAGVSLLVLTVAILFVIHHKKPYVQKEHPIYEDMSSVQRKGSSTSDCHQDKFVLKTFSKSVYLEKTNVQIFKL